MFCHLFADGVVARATQQAPFVILDRWRNHPDGPLEMALAPAQGPTSQLSRQAITKMTLPIP